MKKARKQSVLRAFSLLCIKLCREDRIRTCDPLVPNQVRYRPALLPDPPWWRVLAEMMGPCEGSSRRRGANVGI